MDRSRRLQWAAVAGVVVLLAVVVVVFWAYGFLAPAHPSSAPAPLPRTFVNLTITYDPASGIANYTTPFISMQAHTLVLVTITNYDPTASPLFVPWDNHVIGTVGGNESIDCGSGTQVVTFLPETDIAHTFTVLDPYYNISIPIPPAPALGHPCVVSFELVLGYAEFTNWGCVANCDNGQMAAGRMWGLLLITG